MMPFKKKYQWYFDLRDNNAVLKRSMKIKNTAFQQLLLLDNTA
jgi:hypothetical protein